MTIKNKLSLLLFFCTISATSVASADIFYEWLPDLQRVRFSGTSDPGSTIVQLAIWRFDLPLGTVDSELGSSDPFSWSTSSGNVPVNSVQFQTSSSGSFNWIGVRLGTIGNLTNGTITVSYTHLTLPTTPYV